MAILGSIDALLLTTTTNAVVGPLSGNAIITKATVLNLTASNRTVTVYRIPQGGTVGATNFALVKALTIAGGQTFVLPLSGQAIANSASIYASCSVTNSMNLNLSYVMP